MLASAMANLSKALDLAILKASSKTKGEETFSDIPKGVKIFSIDRLEGFDLFLFSLIQRYGPLTVSGVLEHMVNDWENRKTKKPSKSKMKKIRKNTRETLYSLYDRGFLTRDWSTDLGANGQKTYEYSYNKNYPRSLEDEILGFFWLQNQQGKAPSREDLMEFFSVTHSSKGLNEALRGLVDKGLVEFVSSK